MVGFGHMYSTCPLKKSGQAGPTHVIGAQGPLDNEDIGGPYPPKGMRGTKLDA